MDVFETATGKELAALDGELTPAKSFGGKGIAVAANNGTGDVYVLDSTDNVVDEFDAAGNYLGQFSHGFNGPNGIAVDQATGDIYVVDANDAVIDVFTLGADHTFIYPETGGGLPDGRAYEMVTPAHKNGATRSRRPN